ncbi:hypothetical protein N7499_008186 [Penicillium canescens]|nr:hypothetical protein N7522_012726 [Penicillium canescens]KAJ6076205.1 hypothetical protein N7499_008186 [Penicillium canescens]KAJ6158517.1 hypothetical protein N7485_011343 [Penicillium canescens]
MPFHGQYTVEKVQYPSRGEILSGILFRSTNIKNPPGIVIPGPYSFVKEQAQLQYATRLADEGYAALIFDPRTVGESTGQPRRLENPKMKNDDRRTRIPHGTRWHRCIPALPRRYLSGGA